MLSRMQSPAITTTLSVLSMQKPISPYQRSRDGILDYLGHSINKSDCASSDCASSDFANKAGMYVKKNPLQ